MFSLKENIILNKDLNSRQRDLEFSLEEIISLHTDFDSCLKNEDSFYTDSESSFKEHQS